MTNLTNALAIPIFCVVLVGCNAPVGGPCNYEQHAGIAEVIGIKEDKYQLRFTLATEPGVESHASFPLSRLNGDVFDVRTTYAEVAGAVVGSRFHAVVSVITEGACSPTSYKVGEQIKGANR